VFLNTLVLTVIIPLHSIHTSLISDIYSCYQHGIVDLISPSYSVIFRRIRLSSVLIICFMFCLLSYLFQIEQQPKAYF